jgi:DNA-binding phage protein
MRPTWPRKTARIRSDALETGDAAFIAKALEIVARAKSMVPIAAMKNPAESTNASGEVRRQ